jgi:hypothetical protein
MNTKIAIIGGGWLGCHLASKLKESHDISLFDKQNIFNGSSLYNQNRLHKGFHYSRNYLTRKLCQDTFLTFLEDYGHLVDKVENNYYATPKDKSIIDYETFKSILYYENINFTESNAAFLSNIEGSLIVDERYINPIKAKSYFEKNLQSLLIKKEVYPEDLVKLSRENDLVINTTNNTLLPISKCTYELCLTLVYLRTGPVEFNALTIVDGPFFSIYPYIDNKYTVTDVEHTPICRSTDITCIENYKRDLKDVDVDNLRCMIEEKVVHYYKDFHKHFKYNSFFTSVKVKKASESADRSPLIQQDGNIFTCVTGKIQGIYTLEQYIVNEIINR